MMVRKAVRGSARENRELRKRWTGIVGLAVLVAAAAAILPMTASAAASRSGMVLSAQDRELYLAAFAAAKANKWRAARRLAAHGRLPLAAKLIDWLYFTRPGPTASFVEISDFVAANPHWPKQTTLRRAAEKTLTGKTAPVDVITWFARFPPVSGIGRFRLGEALLAIGGHDDGREMLRQTWVRDDLPRRIERALYRRHRHSLSRADHASRLDRLLWDGKRGAAHRMLSKVDADHRRLGRARLALMEFAGGVDRAIARVPEHLKVHPGLAFERVRWRRAKGFHDRAREILLAPPENLTRPDKWWKERHIQVRRLLRKGHVSEAYRMARDHGQIAGASRAEAEWLAGWIALDFLGDHDAAYDHFITAYETVRFPISIARGAYWAGRAANAMGAPELAATWFRKAGNYSAVYYGQLALLRQHNPAPLVLPPDPVPNSAQAEKFRDRELVQAVRLLVELGRRDLMRPFLFQLNDTAETAGEHALIAVLAESAGTTDLAVATAKRSYRAGVLLPKRGYPIIELLAGIEPHRPLLLALARQESEFNAAAISPAGARGLMQLMPQTARSVARDLKIAYSKKRLTTDASYNARLASAHLADLLETYKGAYVLALAAYNAGPRNVARWLRQWGDPRGGQVDIIDWIELIPISETRNYVQRVMEAFHIYRYRLKGAAVPLTANTYFNLVGAGPEG